MRIILDGIPPKICIVLMSFVAIAIFLCIFGFIPDINKIKIEQRELDIHFKYRNRGMENVKSGISKRAEDSGL